MSEGDGVAEEQEMEVNSEEEALLHFSKYSEARAAVPWEQRSFREKLQYYLDRIFLSCLVLFLLVMFGELLYKVWYVTPGKKILEFILESVSYLFTQEQDKKRLEL